jgi:hypothetical protein
MRIWVASTSRAIPTLKPICWNIASYGEQEDWDPRLDALDSLEAEQVGREPVLEDQGEQAVRRPDREQVEDHGGG